MIHLRDITSGDREMLRRWRNMPEVAAHMFNAHDITDEEHLAWFARLHGDATRRYWIIVCDRLDVGLVNIYDISWSHGRCYWGFYIAEQNVRRKGVFSAAAYSVLQHVFEDRKLRKICGEVLASNEPGMAVHRMLGFREEGRYREHILKGGAPVDVVSFGMLRDEWEASKDDLADRLYQRGLVI